MKKITLTSVFILFVFVSNLFANDNHSQYTVNANHYQSKEER